MENSRVNYFQMTADKIEQCASVHMGMHYNVCVEKEELEKENERLKKDNGRMLQACALSIMDCFCAHERNIDIYITKMYLPHTSSDNS